MRIAYFVDCFPLISETFVLEQITGMLDRGHDVVIFANRLNESGVWHDSVSQYDLINRTVVLPDIPRNYLKRLIVAVRVLTRAVSTGKINVALRSLNVGEFGREALNLSLLVRAAAHFDGPKFDIIHCQFGQLGVDVDTLRRCKAIEGSLVTSFRGADVTKFVSQSPKQFKNLFRYGDIFLAVGESIRNRLIETGCPAEKVQILRSGIDLSRFQLRKAQYIHDPIRLVTVARLAPSKGISFSLQAVKELNDEGLAVDYKIVGDGPCREVLGREAADLGLENIVSFEGAVQSNHVIDILRESDIAVAPSITGPDGEQEGVPNALKEAMAVGVIAVGTKVSGTPELVQNSVNGFLVNERDAGGIARCIKEISSLSREKLDRLKFAARKTIEESYDIESLNLELEHTYRKVMPDRG
jgi:colanic acid/amylovoran biosynthesis glycosyltransferase